MHPRRSAASLRSLLARVALAGSLVAAVTLAPGQVHPVRAAAPAMTPSVVQDGLTYPWDLAFTPDGQMLVTERPGRVRVFATGAVNAALLRTITVPSVRAQSEAGLMGIAVDVDYAANRFVYVCASRDVGGQWVNQVLRYRVASDLSWSAGTTLLSGMRANNIHNGCALEMDRFGKLWISMGDSNDAMRAQDPNSLNGKILRINRDGSVPADNPIMEGAASRTAVYSMGHRNPQGIAFRPDTDQVYAAEHGPSRDDEVNLITPGGNYGWPCYTGAGIDNSSSPSCGPASDYLDPAWASGSPTIATSGLVFADGIPWADWHGQLFVSQLKESDLRRFSVSNGGATLAQAGVHFNGSWGRLRAATRGPAGQLYLTTSNGSNDRVIRVSVTTPVVNRFGGADRYATAAAISAGTSTPGVPVAYVATGVDFPDALTGGAAAAHENGPLLLVTRTTIPASTAAELDRLNPGRIVVLGGTGAVSAAVEGALDAYTSGAVERRSGIDRYETAAEVSEQAFDPGVPAAFIATGAAFADALAGVPAAAHLDAPLLITRNTVLPAATATELGRLKPARIYVLGGPAAVSNGVLAALDAYTTGPVTRLSGADRYATAAAVATLWTRSNAVYAATGTAFPDGLAGGAAAGRLDVPLLLVRPGVVPTETGQAIIRLHPTRVTVLGGTAAVGNAAVNHLRAILAVP
jgi:glucose/arabinose dehydrogenase/putative cell wall-binding protein